MSWISDQCHYLKYAVYSVILTFLLGSLLPWSSLFVHNAIGVEEDKVVGIGILYCTILILVLVADSLPTARFSPSGKAVLVTGCDTGFGLKAALQLDKIGMHVFAGCLNSKDGEGAKTLEQKASKRLKVIPLDVTSDQEVKQAIKFIKENLPKGEKGLWGLVNNAGASGFGEVEFCSMEMYKFVAEVNLFGSIRITKACLPLIRRARGRIVFMASGLSRTTIPTRSVYSLTKYGIQGFATTLRYEMERWGVGVSIIEPGNYIAATNILTRDYVNKMGVKLWENTSQEVKDDYGNKLFDEQVSRMLSYCNSGTSDPSPVLNAYESALLDKYPKLTYNPMDLYWHVRLFIMVHLPSFIGDYLYIGKQAPINKFK